TALWITLVALASSGVSRRAIAAGGAETPGAVGAIAMAEGAGGWRGPRGGRSGRRISANVTTGDRRLRPAKGGCDDWLAHPLGAPGGSGRRPPCGSRSAGALAFGKALVRRASRPWPERRRSRPAGGDDRR